MPRIVMLCAALVAGAFLVAPAAQAAVLITVDKSIQQMTVSVDGRPLYQWPVSTGKAGYDTPNGKFKAFRMERDHFSREWDEAPMPFSIFFTQKGHAIHGSLDVKRLGTPASHGCVRLLPANAEKLFALVEQEGVLNTTVVLTGVAPSSTPAVARRRVQPDEFEPHYAQPQYGHATASHATPSRNMSGRNMMPTAGRSITAIPPTRSRSIAIRTAAPMCCSGPATYTATPMATPMCSGAAACFHSSNQLLTRVTVGLADACRSAPRLADVAGVTPQ